MVVYSLGLNWNWQGSEYTEEIESRKINFTKWSHDYCILGKYVIMHVSDIGAEEKLLWSICLGSKGKWIKEDWSFKITILSLLLWPQRMDEGVKKKEQYTQKIKHGWEAEER